MAEVKIKPGSLTVEVLEQGILLASLFVPRVGLSDNRIIVTRGPGGAWKAKTGGHPVDVDRE